MLVSKAFTFDAAHLLPYYDGECRNLHGHTYRLVVTIDAPVQKDGLAMDFAVLKQIVKNKVVERLDHTYLNDLLENPSAENVVIWIWNELKDALPAKLHQLELAETPSSWVVYRGE
jgi:6-pyruvoyltetrahydropterin/6-carboxytetrahydropterin synthase